MTHVKLETDVREIKHIVNGVKAADGDGVQLTRVIGSPYLNQLDPFLLFDAFGSDKPQDYIGGFPPHPHRGFETVTYMLAGKMRHEDSEGNAGVIEAGGVQWMTAGKGIIHSEMPEQERGLLAGFQLWVNLPAAHKMTSPKYQEKTAAEIPAETRDDGTSLKVIAGQTKNGTQGIIHNDFVSPIYWDVNQTGSDSAESTFTDQIPKGYNAFIYVIEGSIAIGSGGKSINKGQLAVLEDGEELIVTSKTSSRYLVVAGRPLNEPVARGGPFVMNTREEINQAFADYQAGRLI
ncbi:pirin family protein [Aliikangiella coralliicola]|uniref:Pirin family protein n=1 Tax=Aliikangiella coralliicola TaxID=2592383 RepID=A0A545UIS7_9GAMM|nr:pirin family protein [Aliikangiella coralliicola]TQV89370.1 pirin family protein [Aliikangiella coralliicola]